MGYTEYIIENTENERIAIITDVHYCHIAWNDADAKARMGFLTETLKKQYELAPYDAILGLGDYSLDFWGWCEGGSYLWEPSVSNTDNFVKEYVCQFPTKTYMLAGNHEQYGEEKWEKLTGVKREFALVYGDKVFAMCDTFGGDLDPTENSDGTYTGINVEFLKTVLQKHKDKKIYLCLHDLLTDKESEEARQLILENKNIVCAFAGHIHRSITKILPDEWRNLPVLYCGGFGFSNNTNWGIRLVDFNLEGGEICADYVPYIKG